VSYAASIKKMTGTSTGPAELEGIFLENDIYSVTLSPKKDQIFYLSHTSEGGAGTLAKIDGSAKKIVFSSPLRELTANWVNENFIAIQTKPSYVSSGILFSLNPTNGSLDKLLGATRGLSTLVRPDGLKTLENSANLKTFTTSIVTIKDKVAAALPFKTLPEKCVWSKLDRVVFYCAIPQNIPDANYPDDWYKGKILFNDEIWKINSETGELANVANLKDESQREIDAVGLFLDPKEQYLLFTDKHDLTLWSLKIMK
jgi:hypothetical protein